MRHSIHNFLVRPTYRQRLVLIVVELFAAICVAFSHWGMSQDICPAGKVCIDQQTANKLFNTVDQLIAAKDTINKMLAERNASDATIAAANQVIEAYKQMDVVNGQIIAKQKDVMALYEKTIAMYAALVDKLEAKINAPKSAWQKVLSALKNIAILAAGITIGRGL